MNFRQNIASALGSGQRYKCPMNFAMTEEQELLTATLRRFADKDVRTWAPDADRHGQPPDALFQVGARLGLFVDAVPESAGGLMDGRFVHLGRALRGFELGRGCAGHAALLESNVEPALAVGRWGSTSLQAQIFAELNGGALLAMANDAHGRLQLHDDGRSATLGGTIGPVPGAERAAHLLLLANDRAGAPVIVLLPASAATVTAIECSGWRAGAWARWTFTDLVIEPEAVLARGEQAKAAKKEILSWANVSLAARALGVASAAIEYATRYGQERHQFGQAIGDFESIIRLLDKNETRMRACRLLVLQAAEAIDHGAADAADLASRARDLAGDVVTRATIDAVQVFGGYGFVNDYPVEKLMRDARAFEVLHGNEAFERVLAARQGDS